MKQKKVDKLLLETYTRMFALSEPTADFIKLVKEAKLNEQGKKEIPFLEHEITEFNYDKVILTMIKKYKLRGYMIRQFKHTIALGCSPKIKK